MMYRKLKRTEAMILQLVKYYKSVHRRIRVTSTIKLPTELKTLAASPKPLSVPTN